MNDYLTTPVRGVTLHDGVLKRAYDTNIAYLKSLSVDSMLYWFRKKAGFPAPGEPHRGHFEDNIKGQTAGLFMMGAGNSLRWQDDDELEEKLRQVIDCIERCSEDDGYLMAVPKQEFGTKEYPGYVRAWLTFGLIAAGLSGTDKAFPLLRAWQDWFNQCGELPVIKYLHLAYQGISASTAAYFSPVGVREDIEIAEKYYPEPWRLAQFILRDPDAVHIRRQPGREPHPHGSELTSIEGYLDLYRATGNYIYLNAALGAHEMYRESWQHVGGGIVMIEFQDMSPKCYWLNPTHKYNELCCTAYWMYLNQRLHRLFPEDEQYVAEIEKSIYNVILADQAGSEGIRYHAYLEGHKDEEWRNCRVTCCAGTGTRVLASLPEFLYSISDDGLYIDMYAASEITWNQGGNSATARVETEMPYDGAVRVTLSLPAPSAFAVHLRIPGWVNGSIDISLNGTVTAEGIPGTYCTLERVWENGDTIEFILPMSLHATKYEGGEQVKGFERYAFEYGPVLLAAVKEGYSGERGDYITLDCDSQHPGNWMIPEDGNLHFTVKNARDCSFLPYFGIFREAFMCYPLFRG